MNGCVTADGKIQRDTSRFNSILTTFKNEISYLEPGSAELAQPGVS